MHGSEGRRPRPEQGVPVSASPIRMCVQKGFGSETIFLTDFCGGRVRKVLQKPEGAGSWYAGDANVT
jgi:hypothetical protein